MKKIFNIISLLIFSKSILAVNIPKDLYITDKIKKDIEEVSKLKIDKKFSVFAYDSAFAKKAGLDNKKAVKLSENIHGVGISVEESKPETESRFAEYKCNIFFIIKNSDDYWLPKDSFGSWFEARKVNDELEELTGSDNIPFGHVVNDHTMREFIGPSSENLPPSKTINGGSVLLEKYIKNIYPNMSYLNFNHSCSSFLKIGSLSSIWLEKKNGPDFKIKTTIPKYSRFFSEFNIPISVYNKSCKYIQKASSNKYWNMAIEQSEIGFPNSIMLIDKEERYSCNK